MLRWSSYGCEISEELIKEQALAIDRLGLRKLGYTYIDIDDWCAAQPRTVSLLDNDAFCGDRVQDLTTNWRAAGRHTTAALMACRSRMRRCFRLA